MKAAYSCLFLVTCLCSPSFARQRPPEHPRPTSSARTGAPVSNNEAPETEQQARTVRYSDRELVHIKSKVRYTTLIVLPKDEQILDFTCGDKEYWIINGAQNLAYIKPAKAGSQTNLNLITASGN